MPELKLDRIYNGDSLEYLKTLPSGSADLVVSSPPYNIGRGKERRKALEDYLHYQEELLGQCHRILKLTGSLFWEVGSYTDDGSHYPLDILFFPILVKKGMFPKNRIIWPRAHGLQANKRFSDRHEAILWFTKAAEDYKFFLDNVRIPQLYPNKKAWKGPNKGKVTGNPLGKNPGDVWLFENVKHNHEEQTIHPAQFPETLVKRIILATTEKGDIVLDPFMGSGTVARVAKDLGRHFVGAEIDREYWEVANRRLSGEPIGGKFVNLKQLRQYFEKHPQEKITKFSFDAQTSDIPSLAKTDLDKTLWGKEDLWDALAIVFQSQLKMNGHRAEQIE